MQDIFLKNSPQKAGYAKLTKNTGKGCIIGCIKTTTMLLPELWTAFGFASAPVCIFLPGFYMGVFYNFAVPGRQPFCFLGNAH